MSLKTGIQSVQWLVENYYNLPEEKRDNIHINFFGGEPMLRYENFIIPLMEWADRNIKLTNNHSIKWGMTTNGTLLNKNNLRYLAARKDFDILFSCDGDEITQNINRPFLSGQGSFDKINKIIPNLLYYFPNITFRSTITPETVQFLTDNYIYAKEKGFKNYFFMPNCRENWSIEKIEELSYQMSNICWLMYNDIIEKKEVLSYNDLLNFIINFILYPENTQKISCNQCGFGITSVGIDVNGLITACQEKNTITENNLFFIGDIQNGIQKNKHQDLLQYSKNFPQRFNHNLNCNNCSFQKHCSARTCPSVNYDLTGNPCSSNDIMCYWHIILYKIAQAIMETAALENNETFSNFLMTIGNQYKYC